MFSSRQGRHPVQAKQPTVGESESEEAVQPAIVLEPMRADAAAAVSSDAAAAITAAASATAAQPAVTSISTPADTIAPGATAAAGTDAAAVSVDLLSGVSVALRGLRDVSGGQPAQVGVNVNSAKFCVALLLLFARTHM